MTVNYTRDKDTNRSGRETNITGVAKAAGVSIATVSRVINQPSLVSPATRDRVLKVMETSNFQVNPAASALRRGHGNVVTVLAASLAQPWYTKLMHALRTEIEARGFSMLQVDLQHDPKVFKKALLPNTQQLPTGLIVATGDTLSDDGMSHAIHRAHDALPLSVIGQLVPDASWPTIQFTDEAGSYEATREMLQTAATVGFLGRLQGSYLSDERLRGYSRAVTEAGTDPEPWILSIDRRDYETGFLEVSKLIAKGIVPEAIFAINDELALGASRALLANGYTIPGDVSLLGFGNTAFLSYVTPSLSSVDGSADEAAKVAVDSLWAQFEGRHYDQLTILERRIIHRESTRLPKFPSAISQSHQLQGSGSL